MRLGSLITSVMREPWRTSRSRRIDELLQNARTLAEAGDAAQASRLCEEALRADPRHANALLYHGNLMRLQGDWTTAEQSYRRAIDVNPSDGTAHYSLAIVLRRRGALAEALEHLEDAATSSALADEVIRLQVSLLAELERYDEAYELAQAAVREHPSSADAAIALGYAHQKRLEPEAALRCYERALDLGSSDADVYNNRGVVLQDLGRFAEALKSYDEALRIKPDLRLAQFHRGLARLQTGDYLAGWPDYEARLASREYGTRGDGLPRWPGTTSPRVRLIVTGEQGLGDEIMFASCIPDVLRAVDACTIECSPKLVKLFERSFPAAAVVITAEPKPQIDADAQVSSGSLPLHFRRSSHEFPEHHGYLKADPQRVCYWRSRVDRLGQGVKVGLSWQGGTPKTRSALRSVPIERLMPILATPSVHFVSLQYTEAASLEVAELRDKTGVEVLHVPEALNDYDETAALVCALDLTITVCTALVHLAGALGRPTWVAAPHVAEWRYGSDGDTMPWYPSVRLFRQPTRGDWDAVFERIAAELRLHVA